MSFIICGFYYLSYFNYYIIKQKLSPVDPINSSFPFTVPLIINTPNITTTLRVSFLEIHNEEIKDLLRPGTDPKSIIIRENAAGIGIFKLEFKLEFKIKFDFKLEFKLEIKFKFVFYNLYFCI